MQAISHMQAIFRKTFSPLWKVLEDKAIPPNAPIEIHGAGALGYRSGDECRLLGFRYVLDVARDVLVREDVNRLMYRQRAG